MRLNCSGIRTKFVELQMISYRRCLFQQVAALRNFACLTAKEDRNVDKELDTLFNNIEDGAFKSEDDKFNIMNMISENSGVRIGHKMLNEISTIQELKDYIKSVMLQRKITAGNPLEELFDMKPPPPNLKIVHFRKKCDGGPFVLYE